MLAVSYLKTASVVLKILKCSAFHNSGGLCFCSLYRMQGEVYIAGECPSRSLVAEDKVSVSCCEGPCDHFHYCSTVAFLGVMVYTFYGDELREMFGYEEHPYVLAIVLVGLLYGFFIAIICGQRINERHFHVLAKQELTKEYVVEDREADKDVSELDPRHVTELRMLGLY
ncbi:hypothetical protein CASFOL_025790 [Castilleja foliolosa]|uniref:Uncharacterized protein n=1 Tax=Castilleja foliolosa TaxID=1961234 RepID=A0ABD3CTZ8_9LAMI